MAKQQKLVIWGTSGHALVVVEIVQLNGLQIVGFLDDFISTSQCKEIHGLQFLGGRENLGALQASGINKLVVAVGHCNARLELSALAREAGFDLLALSHPQAVIASDVSIGRGSVVMAGAVINPGAEVCESAIINTCASVDHECIINDGVHIGPGARLGGKVVVGRSAWIGIGATIKDRVKIGAGSIVGAGAVVLRDVPQGVVVYGNPARVIREVRAGET